MSTKQSPAASPSPSPADAATDQDATDHGAAAGALEPRLLTNMHAFWQGFQSPDLTAATAGLPALTWWLSGVDDPLLNGVLRARLAADDVDATVAAVRERATAAGVPLLWWVGPDSEPADLSARLEALGLPVVTGQTLMSLPLTDLADEQPPGELAIRPALEPDERWQWAGTLLDAFGMSHGTADASRRLCADYPPASDRYLRLAGWVDGRIVATVALLTGDGVAGVYCVGTLPEYTRRGYGRALTVAALREGRRQGLDVGTLQSTDAGHPVYRRLGFTDLGDIRLHLVSPATASDGG